MRNDDPKLLNIDFDLYTGGDTEFKRELISLMIVDIHDLRKSLENAGQLNDPLIFLRGYHKAKTTVLLLNDKELTFLLEEIRMKVEQDKSNGVLLSGDNLLLFDKLSGDLLKGLSDLNQ